MGNSKFAPPSLSQTAGENGGRYSNRGSPGFSAENNGSKPSKNQSGNARILVFHANPLRSHTRAGHLITWNGKSREGEDSGNGGLGLVIFENAEQKTKRIMKTDKCNRVEYLQGHCHTVY